MEYIGLFAGEAVVVLLEELGHWYVILIFTKFNNDVYMNSFIANMIWGKHTKVMNDSSCDEYMYM